MVQTFSTGWKRWISHFAHLSQKNVAAASHFVGHISLLRGHRCLLACWDMIESVTTFPCVWSSEHLSKALAFPIPLEQPLSVLNLYLISLPGEKLNIVLFPLTVHDCPFLSSPTCLEKQNPHPGRLSLPEVLGPWLCRKYQMYCSFLLLFSGHIPFWARWDKTGVLTHSCPFSTHYRRHIYIRYWFLFNRISQEKSHSLLAFKG